MSNLQPANPNVGPAERALVVADRLFYENGFSATGINQIIAEADVAKASLYSHYPSKADLCLAYLARRKHNWYCELDGEVKRHRLANTRLLAIFDFLLTWMPANDYRGCPFINIAAEFPEHNSKVREYVCDTKQIVRDYVTALTNDAGLLDSGDHVFLLFEAAIVQTQLFADVWPIVAARKATEKLIQHQPL